MAAPKTDTATKANPATSWNELGTGLKYHVEDGILFLAITVPTDKAKLTPTAGSVAKAAEKPGSRINLQVATSHGNVVVPGTGGLKLGMNAFISKD